MTTPCPDSRAPVQRELFQRAPGDCRRMVEARANTRRQQALRLD